MFIPSERGNMSKIYKRMQDIITKTEKLLMEIVGNFKVDSNGQCKLNT